MRKKKDYYISTNNKHLPEITETIYNKVFRIDFNEPGFVVIDLGRSITSEILRSCMLELKNNLSEIHKAKSGQKLLYQWMGRFDQQETTKFHRDNTAADQSFLMLGYEPTAIKSRLYFADYLRLVKFLNISVDEYYEKYNPIFLEGEIKLKPYTTEIKEFDQETYKIVLINNSNIIGPNKTLGVFHKAEIISKDLSRERVLNSTMIYAGNSINNELLSLQDQKNFITTNKINK